MPTSISVAELAQRLHATDQPVLRLDFEAGTVVTDDRPAQGYALTGDAIVFESLAERNRHVAEFVYEELLACARGCIQRNQRAWEDIALLAMCKIGKEKSLSKAEVEAIPSVKELLARKPPI